MSTQMPVSDFTGILGKSTVEAPGRKKKFDSFKSIISANPAERVSSIRTNIYKNAFTKKITPGAFGLGRRSTVLAL